MGFPLPSRPVCGVVSPQIPGEGGPRRLQKICAGGIFGEVGFFLRSPQMFHAVAREPCHLHTLDRAGMAAMQVRCSNQNDSSLLWSGLIRLG